MKLILIRHSKSLPNPETPIPQWGLTAEGTELAKSLAQKSVIKKLEVIYSSLQTKALETAGLLAKSHNLPVKTNKDLTEISSFTKGLIGQKPGDEEFEKFVEDFYQGKIERFRGGETYQEALKRFIRAIQQIIKEETVRGVENIGVVSHGNILSFFSAQYCEYPPLEIHKMIKMPDISVLDWDQKKFVSFFGEHSF